MRLTWVRRYDVSAGRGSFNAGDHARTDRNFDATALARYEDDLWTAFEGGYSMKSRAPSLYERYDWSTTPWRPKGMAGLGRQLRPGQHDLKPETAHTLSVTFDWPRARSLKDGGSTRGTGN